MRTPKIKLPNGFEARRTITQYIRDITYESARVSDLAAQYPNAIIRFEEDYSGGSIHLIDVREETDEEYQARIDQMTEALSKEAERKAKQREDNKLKDQKEFVRLQKKYGWGK